MKRFIAVTLSVLTMLSTIPAYAGNSTRYVYNGKETSVSASVVIKDGYRYLPAAQIFEACGMKVIKKTSNNSITAEAKGKPGYVSIFVGKTTGRMNGTNIHLAKAPFEENGVVYVSSKFIEGQLGVKVSYDQSKGTVYLDQAGEGKITSTAYLNNKAKNNTSKSTSSSNKSTSTAVNSSIDFGAITGRTCTSHSNNKYVYEGATSADVRKYINTLVGNGYTYTHRGGGQLFVASDIYELTKGSSKITLVETGSYSGSSSSYITGQTNASSSPSMSSTVTVTFN